MSLFHNLGMFFERRTTLKVGTLALFRLVRSGPSPAQAQSPPQGGDLLVSGTHAMIRPSNLVLGQSPVLAWAMDPKTRVVKDGARTGQILLLRPAHFQPLACNHSVSDAAGIVGFSAICTHAGCLVSGWKPAEGKLLCPCHGSMFDPAAQGRVVAGPAPRPLPSLPLRVVGDSLTVAGGFSARIGGSSSRTD